MLIWNSLLFPEVIMLVRRDCFSILIWAGILILTSDAMSSNRFFSVRRARNLKPCPEGFKAISVGGKQDCVCDDYHVYWPETGLCYQEFTQGPCGSNQHLAANQTGHAECK